MTSAYSTRAAEYAQMIGTMDAVHTSDRHLVEAWAQSIDGTILDAGCGPGHWTNHLAGLGFAIRGVDLVPDFITHARAAYPGMRFDQGSIEKIEGPDDELGGILSWFSTIHHDPSRISVPITEFARVLRPGGTLLLGYFDSADTIEPFDHAVVRAYRWPAAALQTVLENAGFVVVETHRRAERGRRPVAAIICELSG